MDQDVFIIGSFLITVITLALGVPLVRSYVRRKDRESTITPGDPMRDERLARIENAIEAMALEVERISEGQRFVTKLLAERARGGVLPPGVS